MLFVLKYVCGKSMIESLLIVIICSFFEYVGSLIHVNLLLVNLLYNISNP